MIAERISGNIISKPPTDGKLNVPIDFEWFETDKKRMSKVAEDGTEFGVAVGQTIADGDVLAETEDKRYYAKINTAQLIEIPVASMKEMGRLCFELGNRHLSLKIDEGKVTVPYDHPTMEYTRKIGYEPRIVEGGFEGFLIVKAHAGSGTVIPGTNKTTGDLSEEEQEAAEHTAHTKHTAHTEHTEHQHAHDHHAPDEYESNGVVHRADGTHSHDGGHTWHTH
jgi:urease accessory protein